MGKRHLILLISFLVFLSCGGDKTRPYQLKQGIERPPQYVLLAFDGSKSHKMWRRTVEFSKEFEAANPGKDLKFTYFVSGVYWLQKKNKTLYKSPGHRKGKSAIGFGGNTDSDILTRTNLADRALARGHEVASHACGHYDGAKWSTNDWLGEFDYFDKFIFDAYRVNGIPVPGHGRRGLNLDPNDLRGFRAPLLARGTGLYKALARKGLDYDTSKVARTNYWPAKQNGVWNFPLASLRVVTGYRDGKPVLGKRTLSMDYNFYVAQSKAKPAPKSKHRIFEKQMADSYWEYFKSNYYGNRAPVDIGHHFSLWNGGAYWKAMKRFAKRVCGLPEVRCVTYSEYTDYLESLPASTLARYRKGRFETYSRLTKKEDGPVLTQRQWNVPNVARMSLEELLENGFVPDSVDAHREQ